MMAAFDSGKDASKDASKGTSKGASKDASRGASRRGRRRERGGSEAPARPSEGGGAPLKGSGYVEQKAELSPENEPGYEDQRKELSPVQGRRQPRGADPRSEAAQGVTGPGGALPHLGTIQAAFGEHDVGDVHAHVGGKAAEASEAMGAQAYASGNDVAFGESPDLHTAAHEAAHVVQQRAGVQLKDGVGEAGDRHEQNADAVADRVVAGKSAADLLPGGAGGATAGKNEPNGAQNKPSQLQHQAPVQLLGSRLDEEAGDENKPTGPIAYHYQDEETGEWERHDKQAEVKGYDRDSGRYQTVQRRYTFGRYQELWEREHGRKMTEEELSTLQRGCIGITVLNLGGSGNPPLTEAYNSFEQGHARMEAVQKFIDEHPKFTAKDAQDAGYALTFSGGIGQYKAVMFAQLFWSNQRKAPNRADFDAGKQVWDEKNKWEKVALVLPNGQTIEQMMKEKGRQAVIDYVYNELGYEEFQELTKANHEKNVQAYYLAWAKAMEKKDPDAFPVDEATGKVDMTGYLYQSRPKIKTNDKGEEEYSGGYVNFDYGFWDEDSQSFWHANHMQYQEGEKADKQPMIVYQSTKSKFIAGYADFDRVIFCVGVTRNYDPEAAAHNRVQ